MSRQVGLLLLFFVGSAKACGDRAAEPPTQSEEARVAVRVEAVGSQLWAVSTDGVKELLATDGIGYSAHVAPNGEWIVVDVALFSNLQITRVYRRDHGSVGFVEARNASTEVWASIESKLGLDLEEVTNPRTRFVSWVNGTEAFLVEASGWLPDGREVAETVRIDVD